MEVIDIKKYADAVNNVKLIKYYGKVTKVIGLTIESSGPQTSIGELCYIYPFSSKVAIPAEVVGFKEDKVLLMPLGDMEGIGPGSIVVSTGSSLKVNVSEELIGRVLDGLESSLLQIHHLEGKY